MFGVLTTLINIVSYWLLVEMSINYIISNIIANILSILFAFITNKIYVFKSVQWTTAVLSKELSMFLTSRALTFGLDVALMYVLIDMVVMNDLIAKCLVNILVIVINYVCSKFIFRQTQNSIEHM
ncbi:GtrA family protein [Paenibacillus assamensis]|uniref:GtrA family protein n=1 Tax=Paenibacillus assamensis TaxID=311244 RepID=UPI003CCBC479